MVHEFCHLLTDGLYTKATKRFASKDEIENERERLTDHITRAIKADFGRTLAETVEAVWRTLSETGREVGET